MRPRIVVALPTVWDLLELRRGDLPAWRDAVELAPAPPEDDEVPWDWDWAGWLDAAAREHAGRAQGVFSSGDYPGCLVAALLARRLGLPGADPRALLRASHKVHAREVQALAVPDATPAFAAVDPYDPRVPPELGYPCFVKPVKSSFSMFARLVRSEAELRAHVGRPLVREFLACFPRVFNELLRAHAPDLPLDASRLVAEAPLQGEQVTVEGFVHEGRVQVLAVVDSVVDPATRSFVRFDLPSRLPAQVQARLGDAAARAALALGLEGTPFNVELFWDPTSDRVSIIEVNPRMCGQFADLHEKVLGTSGYEVACALALGRRPEVRRDAGPCRVAASVPLRTFEPAEVVAGPSPEDVRAAEALFPGTRIWTLARPGQVLDEFERAEDGHSQLYAVVNLGAGDELDLRRRLAAITARLGYVLRPLRPLAPRRPAA